MLSPDALLLLVKLLVAATIVVGASLTIERSGPVIGALIASLPISAGPGYVFLAMEHGPAFIEAAALASLPAAAGMAVYQTVYVKLAQRFGTAISLAGGFGGWVISTVAVRAMGLGFAEVAVLAFAAFGIGYGLIRRHLAWKPVAMPRRRWWDLPARAGAVMAVTCMAVLTGRFAGPAVAGVAVLVPVVFTSLIVILQPRIGGPNTAAVLASAIPGMGGFVASVCFLHLTAAPFGNALALAGALGVGMAWNLVLLFGRRWWA